MCPYNGVYIFSVTFSTQNDFVGAYLVVSNSLITLTIADNENGDYDSGSGSVVTQCQSGGDVWLDVIFGGTVAWHTSSHNYFSGFLLNKL